MILSEEEIKGIIFDETWKANERRSIYGIDNAAHAIAEKMKRRVVYSTDAKIRLRHDSVTIDGKQFPCGVAVLWKRSVGEIFVIANSYTQPDLVKSLQDGQRVHFYVVLEDEQG